MENTVTPPDAALVGDVPTQSTSRGEFSAKELVPTVENTTNKPSSSPAPNKKTENRATPSQSSFPAMSKQASVSGPEGRKLFRACAKGDVATIQSLLATDKKLGAYKASGGSTPLLVAVGRRQAAAAEALLQAGGPCHINAADCRGKTALMLAIDGNLPDVATLLIGKGAHVNDKDAAGMSAASLAILNGDAIVFGELLAAGADSDEPIPCMPLLKRLRGMHRLESAVEGLFKVTLVHLAVVKGLREVVDVLLVNGEEATEVDEDSGSTLLHFAIEVGRTDIACAFIEAAKDVNVKDRFGDTPLIFAVKQDEPSIVEKLLSRPDVDINAKDRAGMTPLFTALIKGFKAIATRLIEAKPDLGIKNNLGVTALMLAIDLGMVDVALLLIDAGADVNAKNRRGHTPLHMTVSNTHFEVAYKLIEYGCNIHKKEWRNQKPFDMFSNAEQKARFFVDSDFSLQSLTCNSYDLWFFLVQLTDVEVKGITAKVLEIVQKYPELGRATDSQGRVAVDLATAKSKHAIQSVSLWHGRYRIVDGQRPEHSSETCFVFRAFDEGDLDESQQPRPVVLKMMRFRKQFLCELRAREQGFSSDHVVNILTTYPKMDEAFGMDGSGGGAGLSRSMRSRRNLAASAHPSTKLPARGTDAGAGTDSDTNNATELLHAPNRRESNSADELLASIEQDDDAWEDIGESIFGTPDGATGGGAKAKEITKKQAESLYCIVMPAGDRNLFVALKQERFAGRNFAEVRHVFNQLVKCVKHVHSKGYCHGDVKTLNLLRMGAQWCLIDFDSAAVLGEEPVGVKLSTSYAPPEALAVTDDAVVVRGSGVDGVEPLLAHPSYDVWSLGCILYQLCTEDVRPLFQSGQDDSLSSDMNDEDNLYALAQWTPFTKSKKLAKIFDPLAKNLLSQMLSKDPHHRPSLDRVLAHPFLSLKRVARLVGERAKFDLFLSYRVNSDVALAEKIYDALTATGLNVWWDKRSLQPGLDWKDALCAGLMDSTHYLVLLSKEAINSPTHDHQNLGVLDRHSPCDNLYLEMRLALELQALGLVNRIFPVFIGTHGDGTDGTDGTSTGYDDFFAEGGLPKCADVAVAEVEQELLRMMESQALGTPIHPERTVASVMNAISSHHGVKVCGAPEPAVAVAIKAVVDMCVEAAGEGAEGDAIRKSGSEHEAIRKIGSGSPRREASGLSASVTPGRRRSVGEQSIDNHSLGSKPVTTRSPAVSTNPWKRQSQRQASPRGGDASQNGSERLSSSNAAQSQAASQAVSQAFSQAVSRDVTRRVPKAPHAKRDDDSDDEDADVDTLRAKVAKMTTELEQLRGHKETMRATVREGNKRARHLQRVNTALRQRHEHLAERIARYKAALVAHAPAQFKALEAELSQRSSVHVRHGEGSDNSDNFSMKSGVDSTMSGASPARHEDRAGSPRPNPPTAPAPLERGRSGNRTSMGRIANILSPAGDAAAAPRGSLVKAPSLFGMLNRTPSGRAPPALSPHKPDTPISSAQAAYSTFGRILSMGAGLGTLGSSFAATGKANNN